MDTKKYTYYRVVKGGVKKTVIIRRRKKVKEMRVKK